MSLFFAQYAYARVVVKGTDSLGQKVEIIAGIEILDDDHKELYEKVRKIISLDLDFNLSDIIIAARVEDLLSSCWPSRSYFLEVGRGDLDEWVQVFEPYHLSKR